MSPLLSTLSVLALAATRAFAQTHSDCNPLNATNTANGPCPDDPALSTTFDTTFNASMTEFDQRFFNVTAGPDYIHFDDEGAHLTIADSGQSIEVKTHFYIMFGHFEMIFRAASGQGVISTVISLSDDLDEVDWEIKGGIAQNVSNTYFGWGNMSQMHGEEPSTAHWPGGAMGGFHNYSVDWSQEKIDYYMDGELVRTAEYQEPGLYPQTPSFIRFGVWAAGDESKNPEGTVTWAGGPTDWSKGPFTMTIQSLKVVDAQTNVSSYTYADTTGSYQSITMNPGESEALKLLNKKSSAQRIGEQWQGLSTGAKIGIGAGIGGLVLVLVVLFAFYCVRQRRAGKAEKARDDKEWDGHQAELMEYRNRMRKGDFAISHLGHGEKR